MNYVGRLFVYAIVFGFVGIAGCSFNSSVLLMKVVGEDEPFCPKEIIAKLPPETQKGFARERPTGSKTYVIFWRKGFGAPKNTGDRALILSDKTECQPHPMAFHVVVNTQLDQGDKPTGEEYLGAYFWVPKGGKPIAMRIQGRRYELRWATMEEAITTGGGSWTEPTE